MNLISALVVVAIFFLLFLLIAYFLAELTRLSSLVLAFILAIFMLFIIYPPYLLPNDKPDASMWIYMAFIFFGLILSIIYILCYTLADSRIN